MNAATTSLLSRLERRRVELGVSCAAVARQTGLGLRTVQRVLGGEDVNATLSTFLKIADVLGVGIELEPRDLNDIRLRRANEKARRLVGMVQATMGLEASALDADSLEQLHQRTVRDLLRGSDRRLWDD